MAVSPAPGGHLDDPPAIARTVDSGGIPPRDEANALHVLGGDLFEVLEHAKARPIHHYDGYKGGAGEVRIPPGLKPSGAKESDGFEGGKGSLVYKLLP